MQKIPTLYSSYQELILDIDIYGKIVSTPHQSLAELTETLFEEFKRSKPLPTLEARRYELSKLVNPDYKIVYNRELELQDNEALVDLETSTSSFEIPSFDSLKPLIPEVMAVFSYENQITDDIRGSIVEKYDLSTGEEFQLGIEQTEQIVGSTTVDKDTILTDDEIDSLGNEDEFNLSDIEIDEDFIDEENIADYTSVQVEDVNLDVDVSEDDDIFDGYDDYSSYDEDTVDTIDVDTIVEVIQESDDYSGDDYDSYDDYSDDYDVYEDTSTEEVDTDTDSDEDYYDDFSDYDSDDYDDYTEEQETVDDVEDYDSYDDYSEEDIIIPTDTVSDIPEDDLGFVDSVIEEDTDDIEFISTENLGKVVETPTTPVEIYNKPKEEVDRSSEPTDIRQFLRKHPRCEYSFALKYFTKKQINDAIKVGKIIKKGNILKI